MENVFRIEQADSSLPRKLLNYFKINTKADIFFFFFGCESLPL